MSAPSGKGVLWTILVAACGLLASALGSWALYVNDDMRTLKDKTAAQDAKIAEHNADHRTIEFKLDLLLKKSGIDVAAPFPKR
jgi:hypothetical protein